MIDLVACSTFKGTACIMFLKNALSGKNFLKSVRDSPIMRHSSILSWLWFFWIQSLWQPNITDRWDGWWDRVYGRLGILHLKQRAWLLTGYFPPSPDLPPEFWCKWLFLKCKHHKLCVMTSQLRDEIDDSIDTLVCYYPITYPCSWEN